MTASPTIPEAAEAPEAIAAETVVVAIFGKTMVEGEPPPGRAVATAAASCGCCVRPLAWHPPPGSISTDSTPTAPTIGFGADGCDSTTVGLPGVISATTGRSAGPGLIATATLCLDVACLPSGCLERNVR